MIIKLPNEFYFADKDARSHAYVKDGILYVCGRINYENLMYTISFVLQGYDHCYYCGEYLTHRKRTLDHKFPRAWGGVSIPDNLIPCCKSCNQAKRDMTYNQFIRWKSCFTTKEKDSYYKEAIKRNTKTIQKGKLQLPSYWLTDYDVSEVLLAIKFDEISKTESKKVGIYYEKNGGYPKPIIVSSNGWVFKGFNILYHAKVNGITIVPAIVLENVVKV